MTSKQAILRARKAVKDRAPKSWEFWCGFSGGKPYVAETHDEHCVIVGGRELPVKLVELYLTEKDARPRFMDVRRVRLTIVGEK